MYLADVFIQNDLQKRNKAFIKEPTIAVVHNAWLIRQLYYEPARDVYKYCG